MSNRATAARGGGWLLGRSDSVATPEGFDGTTRDIAETARTFAQREVGAVIERMESGELDLNVALMRTAGAMGLLASEVPEAYGGLGLSKTVSVVITEELGPTGGFAATHAAHTSLGTLPLVYFGTDDQRNRYLGLLANGEWIAAYALTEPGSGSDALAARATATLSDDGAHYVLSGSKMWITNAGFADLFTVFAKIDGDKFTAFLVERDSPGLSTGEEEHKMGIRSSSTRILNLDDVRVPVANVLGEIGKGHRIAFNVLNVGRYKIGAATVGAGKRALHLATAYAQERNQFGAPIASFGLIQHKLAQMATRLFAAESALYRTMGLIDARIGDTHDADALRGIEEYAVEASILKVLGSETLDYCVDEAVQIHGGLGFSAEYEVERAYRDSRPNRIFEGTNEINRLLIPGMLLKRAMRGDIPLMQAATEFQTGLLGAGSDERRNRPAGIDDLTGLVLLLIAAAVERYGTQLEREQEVLAAIADTAIDAYAADSALTRARMIGGEVPLAMAQITLVEAAARARTAAATALSRIGRDGDARRLIAAAGRLTEAEPVDVIDLRRRIARAVLEADGYPSFARSAA